MNVLRADGPDLSEEDILRARLYAFLARILGSAPDESTLAQMRALGCDDTPLGRAFGDLAEVAARMDPVRAEAEYTALFIGLTQGRVVPFASFYKTGFLYEKPLADLRSDLGALGIAAAGPGEPEDHVAALFEVMHALILGRFGRPADLDSQRRFWAAHIGDWAPRLFADIESADEAELYRPVARIGSLFLAIEAEAFAMV